MGYQPGGSRSNAGALLAQLMQIPAQLQEQRNQEKLQNRQMALQGIQGLGQGLQQFGQMRFAKQRAEIEDAMQRAQEAREAQEFSQTQAMEKDRFDFNKQQYTEGSQRRQQERSEDWARQLQLNEMGQQGKTTDYQRDVDKMKLQYELAGKGRPSPVQDERMRLIEMGVKSGQISLPDAARLINEAMQPEQGELPPVGVRRPGLEREPSFSESFGTAVREPAPPVGESKKPYGQKLLEAGGNVGKMPEIQLIMKEFNFEKEQAKGLKEGLDLEETKYWKAVVDDMQKENGESARQVMLAGVDPEFMLNYAKLSYQIASQREQAELGNKDAQSALFRAASMLKALIEGQPMPASKQPKKESKTKSIQSAENKPLSLASKLGPLVSRIQNLSGSTGSTGSTTNPEILNRMINNRSTIR